MQNKNSASVGFLRTQSEETEKTIISLYILALAEASKLFPNNWDSNSITDTAFMILNEYPQYKSEELILILNNGTAGRYGKMYHAISCASVMEWCLQYDAERSLFCERQCHNSSFSPEDKNFTLEKSKSAEVRKEFNELKKAITIEYVNKAKEEEAAWKKVLSNLSDEFFALNLKQKPGDTSPIRFVKYAEKMMDYEEYINFRLKELKPQNK